MYPQDIVGIDSYHFVVIVVSIVCTSIIFTLVRREGVSAWRLLILQLLMALVAFAGAKLFSLYVRDWQHGPLGYELQTGWRWPGGLLAMVLVGPLLAPRVLQKMSFYRYGDLMGITLAFGMGIMRFACFFTGCCLGEVNHTIGLSYARGSTLWQGQYSDGAIAVTATESLPVIPLHLYFMVASFAIAAYLLWFDSRRQYNGQVFLLFLLLHEGAKGVLETLRNPYIAELQASSLITAFIAGIMLVAIHYWRRQQPNAFAS